MTTQSAVVTGRSDWKQKQQQHKKQNSPDFLTSYENDASPVVCRCCFVRLQINERLHLTVDDSPKWWNVSACYVGGATQCLELRGISIWFVIFNVSMAVCLIPLVHTIDAKPKGGLHIHRGWCWYRSLCSWWCHSLMMPPMPPYVLPYACYGSIYHL